MFRASNIGRKMLEYIANILINYDFDHSIRLIQIVLLGIMSGLLINLIFESDSNNTLAIYTLTVTFVTCGVVIEILGRSQRER